VRTPRAAFVPALLLVIASSVTACSDSGNADATTSSAPTATDGAVPEPTTKAVDPGENAVPSSLDTGTGLTTDGAATSVPREPVLDVRIPPGTGSGFVGARADVSLMECEGSEGRWGAAGSVTNPTNDTADYRIYVAFLDSSGATAGLTQVDVESVRAGATTDWSGYVSLQASGLRCVVRVERTAA